MVRKSIPQKIVALLTAIFFFAGSLGPAFGFSIGAEREVGEKLLYSVRSSFELIEDPDITLYITKLGRSVLDVAGIQYFDYHFFIINSKQFNAFAAPSGLVFFYSGLIESMNSENELLSVMAHEIGHVVKRHLADRIEKSTYSSIASLGIALAAVAFGGAAAPALLTGALATNQSLNLHFSRQNEEEADAMAFTWLEKMHRDPTGQTRMLESMRRIARYRSEKLPQYLLTHPNPEARLGFIEGLIASEGKKAFQNIQKEDNFSFLRFKYRIMNQSKDPDMFRVYLSNLESRSEKNSLASIMARYGLALVAEKQNDSKRALALLDEVAAAYPDRNIILADRGRVLFGAGKLQEAEKVLNELLRKEPSNVYGEYLLGKLLYRKGDIKSAADYFNRVSYEIPEFSSVYYELGQIASDQHNTPLSNFFLGKHYLYEGRLKLAESKLRSAGQGKKLDSEKEKERQSLLKKIKKLKK